jgi:hypothetical protein
VLSAQAVNEDTSKRILECQDAYKSVKALAIAPYFAVSFNSTYNPTMDELLDRDLPNVLKDYPALIARH